LLDLIENHRGIIRKGTLFTKRTVPTNVRQKRKIKKKKKEFRNPSTGICYACLYEYVRINALDAHVDIFIPISKHAHLIRQQKIKSSRAKNNDDLFSKEEKNIPLVDIAT